MPPNHAPRRAAIRAALRLARDGDRTKDLGAVLQGVALNTHTEGPIDEIWLAAELSYRAGRLRESTELFTIFATHPAVSRAPAWQRYFAAHRKSFIAIQLGQPRAAQRALSDAEKALRSGPPSLRRHASDLDAMRAHLAELRGDFATARTLFEAAHHRAIASKRWARARTTASDAARLAMIQNQPADGLRWIAVARSVPGTAERHVLDALRLREAILHTMLGQQEAALAELDALLVESSGAFKIDVLCRRADVYRELGRQHDAKRDLTLAATDANAEGLARHELYARKDLAARELELGDNISAASEFAQALKLALTMVPPPLLVLQQLLEDILEMPGLVGSDELTTQRREQLERILRRMSAASGESAYQRGTREDVRKRLTSEAIAIFESFIGERIVLAESFVLMNTHRAIRKGGGQHLGPAELSLLRLLLKFPEGISSEALEEALERSPETVHQLVKRLREKIGERSLTTERRGRAKAIFRIVMGAARAFEVGARSKK